MAYANITFKDKNPVKRWLHRRRLVSAIKAVKLPTLSPPVICDFGAGNGELCKRLAERYPGAGLICYEPSPALLNEAKENLKTIPNVRFLQDIGGMEPESIDLLFSLEVFEHLPDKETHAALKTIHTLLKSKGQLIIGVPMEIGIPALYKGAFRMVRRYGAFDANFHHVFLALIGRPPTDRPVNEITPGFNYYFEHLGFDYRRLLEMLKQTFDVRPQKWVSPFSIFGPWVMPEIYFSMIKN